MWRTIALSAIGVLLAACQPEASGGGEAVSRADVPAESATALPIALSARGTEPFWRMDVTDDEFKLARADAPVQTAKQVAVAVAVGYISLISGPSPSVHAEFTKGECSDRMSDLKYPYSVKVTWGAETLKGCGFPTAEEPHEGE
jgi:uncharacterized membrane protein